MERSWHLPRRIDAYNQQISSDKKFRLTENKIFLSLVKSCKLKIKNKNYRSKETLCLFLAERIFVNCADVNRHQASGTKERELDHSVTPDKGSTSGDKSPRHRSRLFTLTCCVFAACDFNDHESSLEGKIYTVYIYIQNWTVQTARLSSYQATRAVFFCATKTSKKCRKKKQWIFGGWWNLPCKFP